MLKTNARSSCATLQARLCEALDVQSHAKQAHWNVRGPLFFSLHLLFDRVHEASEKWADLLAERIMQLNGAAEGTLRAAAARSRIPEYPLGTLDGPKHAEALTLSLSAFSEAVRLGIEEAEGDPLSVDVLTEIGRSVEQYRWMVGAHLKEEGEGALASERDVA